LASLLVLFVGGCAAPKTDPAFVSHESLLTILADFERFANHDLYRFGAPRDPSGMNAYRAAVARLDNYQRLYPERFADVVAYARGQALERLGDFGPASEAFREAMRAATSLSPEAAEASAVNLRFEALIAPTFQARTLEEYLEALETRRAAFAELAAEFAAASSPQPVHAFVARRQAERAEVERAEALWKHRDVLKDGATRALAAWEAILERHAESARIERHRLRLGDCHYEMAREYAQETDPDEAGFDLEGFDRMTQTALSHYRTVERAYGYPERLEARGKIVAVEAFAARARERAQLMEKR
jgi:tetratricopeptide (TPR) repeat protein